MGSMFNLNLSSAKSGGKGAKSSGEFTRILREAGQTGNGLTAKEILLQAGKSFSLEKDCRVDIRAGQKESYERGDLVFSVRAAYNIDARGQKIPPKIGNLSYFIIPAEKVAMISEVQFQQLAAQAVDIGLRGRASGKRLADLTKLDGSVLDSYRELAAQAEAEQAEAEQAEAEAEAEAEAGN